MKFAIVVQGRFHAFDLVRELSGLGHDVTLITNYPKWTVRQYGAGSAAVRSYWQHGAASRLAGGLGFRVEAEWDRAFGRWAAGEIGRGHWDVIHCWSGVSLELIRQYGNSRGTTLLMRGSSHIRTQARLLAEERDRTGVPVECPSALMIEREEEEYELADQIVVLSNFAYRSFVDEGISSSKLRLLPLGVDCAAFRPAEEIVRERCRRILSDTPLRVLCTGALSLRKGMCDAVELVREADPRKFAFRFVGPVSKDAVSQVQNLRSGAQVIPKQPQNELSKQYAWADLFFTPTIEDGFSVVLSQAQASGLPILCTTNCGGSHLIREGETGWVLPIRSPEAFLTRMTWCNDHREKLARMADRVYHNYRARDWQEVARDFESISRAALPRDAIQQEASAHE